jgi:hypothetical protein
MGGKGEDREKQKQGGADVADVHECGPEETRDVAEQEYSGDSSSNARETAVKMDSVFARPGS